MPISIHTSWFLASACHLFLIHLRLSVLRQPIKICTLVNTMVNIGLVINAYCRFNTAPENTIEYPFCTSSSMLPPRLLNPTWRLASNVQTLLFCGPRTHRRLRSDLRQAGKFCLPKSSSSRGWWWYEGLGDIHSAIVLRFYIDHMPGFACSPIAWSCSSLFEKILHVMWNGIWRSSSWGMTAISLTSLSARLIKSFALRILVRPFHCCICRFIVKSVINDVDERIVLAKIYGWMKENGPQFQKWNWAIFVLFTGDILFQSLDFRLELGLTSEPWVHWRGTEARLIRNQ